MFSRHHRRLAKSSMLFQHGVYAEMNETLELFFVCYALSCHEKCAGIVTRGARQAPLLGSRGKGLGPVYAGRHG